MEADGDEYAGSRSTASSRNKGRKCVWSDAYMFSKRVLTKTVRSASNCRTGKRIKSNIIRSHVLCLWIVW